MKPLAVIDADGHLTDSDNAIAPYLEEPFRSRRRPFHIQDNWDRGLRGKLGSSAPDAETWLKAMDKEGIDVAVLYPTAALSIGTVREADFAAALCRAYNDFVYDRFVRQSDRLKGVAIVPFQTVHEAVRELNRAATKLGMVAVMLPAVGLRTPLGCQEYWPIYEEAERLNVALGVHAGPRGASQFGLDLFDRFIEVHTICHPFGQMAQLTSIFCNGVPEKFPRLRIAFLEAGCGWVPYWMERLDEEYEKRNDELPLLKAKPSEYMRSGRIFYSFEPDEGTVPYVIDRMGEDVLLYASDFPHWDSGYPHTVKKVVERQDISEGQKKKLLGENARRFYNLD
ncbi:MAG: amidohydrolase [Deltaproteobacteria bacterium]|nr:amidohydrolase [Deltaproteobacteria bacterium]